MFDRVGEDKMESAREALLSEPSSKELDGDIPQSPMDRAGVWSLLGFCWVTPLLTTGAKRQLDLADIPVLGARDSTRGWSERFQEALDVEREAACQGKRKASLLRVAHQAFGAEFYSFAGLQLLNDLLGFSGPILLKSLVTYVEDYRAGLTTIRHGLVLLLVLVLCYWAAAILSTQYSLRMARVQLHVRTGLTMAIYRQVLRCRAAQIVGSAGGGNGREVGGNEEGRGAREGDDGGGARPHCAKGGTEGSSGEGRKQGQQTAKAPTKLVPALSTGGITNLMTVDVQRIQDAASSFNTFWSLPLQVGFTLFLLYREVSYAFVAGLVVLALMVPVNAALASAITRVTRRQMTYKDARVQACNDMLHGIRTLKLLAWEDHLARLLGRLRGQEVRYLAQRKYLDAWCVYFWAATPVVTSLATFGAVVLREHSITPASVFTTIALLNMLIFPMNAFPWVINGLMEARISLGRLQSFLLEIPELPRYHVVIEEAGPHGKGRSGNFHAPLENAERGVLAIEAYGSFAWDVSDHRGPNWKEVAAPVNETGLDKQQRCTSLSTDEMFRTAPLPVRELDIETMEAHAELNLDSSVDMGPRSSIDESADFGSSTTPSSVFEIPDLRFCVSWGEIVGIYGKIGSGKSTLLAALLGETFASPGSRVILRARRRAYVAQNPWLQRGSVRDNIVFGLPYDGVRFQAVLQACALLPDLKTLPDGDQTEIGERGGTLSGGQRLRVALARALYSKADLYLLDDPFSGLDGQTAWHVAREAVYGMMRREGATVVIVSHTLPLLGNCDAVIRMQAGRMVERLRFRAKPDRSVALTGDATGNGGFEIQRGALTTHLSDTPKPHLLTLSDFKKNLSLVDTAGAVDAPMELAQEENRETGHVKYSVLKYYRRGMGHGLTAGLLICLSGMQLSANAFTYWLSLWSSCTSDYTPQNFLVVSGTIAVINSLFTFLRSFLFAYGGLRAARRLHDQLLRAVLGAPMAFFEAHPVGRVLNRFAQDTYIIDDSLPFMLNIFLAQGVGLIGTAIVLLFASPWSVAVLVLVAIVYQRLQTFYRASSRELKRLDAVSRSPLLSHFSETISGASTVRAFGATDAFIGRSIEMMDANQRVGFIGNAASQWLGFRLQAFGLLVVASVAVWAVGSCAIDHPVSAGLIGLSLSYTWPLVGNLSGLLNAYTETEKEMVAVERVHEYTTEPPEPDVVFSTMIGKGNLDPKEEYSDAELCAAMQACHLEDFLLDTINDVDTPNHQKEAKSLSPRYMTQCLAVHVEENGRNFSVGQRQLLCLCRGLLKRTKIVCVDEATASLDMTTDALMRRTLARAFKHATVITIAHRMSTVLDLCDRVLVLSEGKVVEDGNPQELIRDPNSCLARLSTEEKLGVKHHQELSCK
ncbi:hypothetical protein NSK_002858 [Nannochloropsis salina CCMP1776]|uniref:ABC-type xenobiotic transporter n=1 Tax=Nannochloropsis salina CCMP1776 TaxID=1027361 RepID=A0A4D9DBM9_9STRA|nr:hypothetical protein NSK_002858 [Nannochloropsis salina CCMP1776]|eukprot:TFJ86038.1 hypothetical protein NSK_002858 [Nannochloropsis salina CCMP1776]